MKKIIIVVVLILIVGAGAFYGGMKYGQSNILNSRQQFFRGQSANVGRSFRPNNNIVAGEVISKDDQSITLKMQDNSSKIVFFSDATTILKTDQGSMADIDVGQQIMVTGQENADGSYTAQTIQQRENPLPTNGNQ